ncbi:MAG: PTS system mannose/fructose/N-acetylgalactosamine-transporter subunit IIB [Candidatus Zhuqueibacterota bacterium]|jgi:PTS system mannose-specific IIB component
MPLILVRVDDRLVHGQVVVGWGLYLNPDRIILCSDSIASSPWEKELYMSAEATAPYPLKISVSTQEETLHMLKQTSDDKTILLVESPQHIVELIEKGLDIDVVNIGGMHFKHGKTRLAAYIFVDNEDMASLKKLLEMNIRLEGRDVPTAKSINLSDCLKKNPSA